MKFEWDDEKAKVNLKKHRVSFDEAVTVFLDPFAMTIPDPDHSERSELRYIEIGSSDKCRLLVVVYTERGPTIRIISCRKANHFERICYEEGSKEGAIN
ncbi:MAG: BrnT family toxin [Chlorobium sp.]|nr:MAG: BrnT family toxin [Chlorobium sp.]